MDKALINIKMETIIKDSGLTICATDEEKSIRQMGHHMKVSGSKI